MKGAARNWRWTASALALGCAVGSCSDSRLAPDGNRETPPQQVVYLDVGANLDEQIVLTGRRIHPVAWKLGDDTRATLGQHAPSRVGLRLRPQAPQSGLRTHCRMRFGIGMLDSTWEKSDGVGFKIWAQRASGDTLLFEESLDPKLHSTPLWQDREIAIPDFDESFDGQLILETEAGPLGNNNFDEAGWAAPHVVCDVPASESRSTSAQPNIVLISLDTLRPDHLGLYGYDKDTSPSLDSLANESWVFENAFAVAPFTMPSHASMFTGLYPHEHGAGHSAPFAPLGPKPVTLAELLSDAGYRTLAFSGGGILSERNGFARGFERWTERTRARLESVLPSVYAALDSPSEKPTFLFLHTYDIHGPYYPEKRSAAPSLPPAPTAESGAEWGRIGRLPNHRYLELERFANLQEVVGAYDAGIRSVDRQLGEFIQRLKDIGMWDNTILVVTSDHGEALYDRSLYIGHSLTLYDEEIRIPLLIKLAGEQGSRRYPELVDQTDLLPTLLEEAGLEPLEEASGTSITARIRGQSPPRNAVEGEAAHTGARFLRTAELKVIGESYPRGSANHRVPNALGQRFVIGEQAFDLMADRAERRNLYESTHSPANVTELMDRLKERPRPGAVQLQLDDVPGDILEQLRQLGYVE